MVRTNLSEQFGRSAFWGPTYESCSWELNNNLCALWCKTNYDWMYRHRELGRTLGDRFPQLGQHSRNLVVTWLNAVFNATIRLGSLIKDNQQQQWSVFSNSLDTSWESSQSNSLWRVANSSVVTSPILTNTTKTGERGSPLYKLFGAGWVQKGVGGIFLKIRPHSCV